ncbi:heme biosynthesis protein HemY, partial [Oleiagrimonas soli]
GRLPPGGWLELAEAALLRGDIDRARSALEPLRKSGALDAGAYAALQLRVLSAALQRAPSVDALHALWADLPRVQRRQPELIAVYATHVSRFGRPLPAMDEIESALRRQWSPALVAAYGQLQGQDVEGRLRRAEGWLDAHPGDATLLTALGRMCVRIQLWGKARQYLSQALALEPSAEAWEILGETYAGQGNPLLAQQCYRNALHMTRGEATEALPGTNAVRQVALTVDPELRNAHGVPQLPDDKTSV